MGQRTLDDLYWISVRAGIETGRPWVHGVTQTLSWLCGRSPAPISGRVDQPITRPEAEAEKWYAVGYNDELLPTAHICSQLHVTHLPPITGLNPGIAVGVVKTLNWLLGAPNALIPLDIPTRRDDDGQVICAQQRYDEAIAARGHHLLPEERIALRRASHRQAELDAVLADIIEDTKRSIIS